MRPKLSSALAGAFLALSLAHPALADKPKHSANRLAKETSPYLLLHAHNPVDWYPWGPEALAKAKAEDRPIFLSIGYSSCFWCHVMERECFEDEAIARLMNSHFLCIKVDREERPDVDQVYMTALQAISGGGGWPMSMFLTPDGRPFFGGTYFPPKARDRLPAFPDVLQGVADAWRDERKAIERSADELTEVVRKVSAGAAARRRMPLSYDMIVEGRARLAEQFDTDFGGFGFDPDNPRRPKFPEPPNLVFLMQLANGRTNAADPRLKGPDPLAMVTITLDHMARGGIRDHLAGGYHRYSTDRGWNVPHFEKMLYDNAQLASAHLRAFELTKDPRWRQEAEATFAFVARSLTAPEGGFYSALDAETEGDEGGYYAWTRDEVKRILAEEGDYDVFARVYGLDRPPNFENERYVLTRRHQVKAEAELLNTTSEALEARLAPLRAKLLAARDKRAAPLRDDKVLTAWNGLMIAAYADGYRILKEDAYRQAAEKAADFLLTTLRRPDGRLLRTYRAGQAKLAAYLEDYAFLIEGLLHLHAATGDSRRLTQARELSDRMIADFADKDGGFFFTADGHESLLARTKDPYDNALPSGNSVAIQSLVELAKLIKDTRYFDEAGKALEAFSPVLAQNPGGAPLMLLGLREYLDARPTGAGPAAGSPEDQAKAIVTAKAVLAPSTKAAAGGELKVTVTLSTKEGWHVYANPASSETLKPTVVSLGSGPASLLKVDYPAGREKTYAGESEKVRVYEGQVNLVVHLRLEDTVKAGPVDLELRVRYQACNDRACLAPATLTVPVRAEIQP
jgi:uncharacterized protein YyaL (SSP411 family)